MAEQVTVINRIFQCIEHKESFVLNAGAGSGKTFTLIQTIDHIANLKIQKQQKILCVTFTNVAKDEILSRLKNFNNDKIIISTLHDFVWDYIKQFQKELQKQVKRLVDRKIAKLRDEIAEAQRKIDNPRHNTNIEKQNGIFDINSERITKYCDVDYDTLEIKYDIYSAYYRGVISHDDVLEIMSEFLDDVFFAKMFLNSFPYILIDEYQDTNYSILSKILERIQTIPTSIKSVVGLYGDSMQQIYSSNNFDLSGLSINEIDKLDNYRTNQIIVSANNKLRGDGLEQNCTMQNPLVPFGSLEFVFNMSTDIKLKDFQTVKDDFGFYKRLYLSNRNIADEIGFSSLSQIFNDKYNKHSNEKLLKLEDPFLNFIMNHLVVLLVEFEKGNYYNIIQEIKSINEIILKRIYNEIEMLILDNETNLEKCLNVFIEYKLIDVKKYMEIVDTYDDEDTFIQELLTVKVEEFKNLRKQIDNLTTLDTLHGVKGKEFEKVIINIFYNQPWNQYDFDKLIKKQDMGKTSVKNAHKLLYVACTRAKTHLIINYMIDPVHKVNSDHIKDAVANMYGVSMRFTIYE